MIVIIGENRSFDHLFATYTPPPGQSVWNTLMGIFPAAFFLIDIHSMTKFRG